MSPVPSKEELSVLGKHCTYQGCIVDGKFQKNEVGEGTLIAIYEVKNPQTMVTVQTEVDGRHQDVDTYMNHIQVLEI